MSGISLIRLALAIILAVVVTLLALQFDRNGHFPGGQSRGLPGGLSARDHDGVTRVGLGR